MTGQQPTFSWQPFSFGSPSLSLSLPGTPLPQQATLPQSVLSRISRYDAYYIKDPTQGIVVTLMHVTYTNDIVADIKGAADGTLSQWEYTGSRVDVLHTFHDEVEGRSRLLQSGLYFVDGQENEFTNIVIGEDEKLWQVIVIIRAGDKYLQQAVEKLINSITFKKK